jgi:hypothetical protein
MSTVRKNITIRSDQEKFLSENNLSLSRIVQKTLEFMMLDGRTFLSEGDIDTIIFRGITK